MIIRHHVLAIEEFVPHSDIPFSYIDIQFSSARTYIFSDHGSIILHCLKPAKPHRENLKLGQAGEVETNIWIEEDIVHNAFSSA